ncbi:hypothetical protein JCM19992_01370 [Thermostilla marina]
MFFVDANGRGVFLTGSHTWANFQERGVRGETPDFDYDAYLAFLDRFGHNFMRMWMWEHALRMQFVPADVPIRYAPLPYRRTGPGKAADGLPKFDLEQFDESFFRRLRARVEAAREHRIYVAVMLFQGFSVEQKGTDGVDPHKGNPWEGHPFNAQNNINGIDGDLNHDGEGIEVHTLADPQITRLQERFVAKVIDTLGDLDNVVWEICNEGHRGSLAWQDHMARFIRETEKKRSLQHPIGITGAPLGTKELLSTSADWIAPTGKQWLSDPPGPSGGKRIVVDTDHIAPWDYDPTWPWRCLTRGCSFILMDGYMDFRLGTPEQPNPEWDTVRRAMGAARRASERIDLARAVADPKRASTGFCLVVPGESVLVFQPNRGKPFSLNLPAGRYRGRWHDLWGTHVVTFGDLTGNDSPQLITPPREDAVVFFAERVP